MQVYFIKSMALFWVLAEMVILVFLRQGVAFVQRKEKKYLGLSLSFSFLFFLLVIVAFWGEHFFSGYFDFSKTINLYFFRHAVWHLFCTMWVVLEGSIMFYCLHAYFILKQSVPREGYSAGPPATMNFASRYGVSLLVTSSIAFFLFYEYRVFGLIEHFGLGKNNLKNIYLFYIKICGMFWFLIEATVACIGFKTYYLLKRTMNRPHGIY